MYFVSLDRPAKYAALDVGVSDSLPKYGSLLCALFLGALSATGVMQISAFK